MAQLNRKPSNSELNKSKTAIKTRSKALSWNMIGNSLDQINFLDKLLSTNGQIVNLRKAFAKNLSTDIKLSKTQLCKIIQSGRFLGKIIGLLLKT